MSLGILCVLGLLALGSWDWWGVTAGVGAAGGLGLDIYRMSPYFSFCKKESISVQNVSDNSRMLTLISANVRQGNRQVTGLLQLIQENSPDVVILLEPDHWWETHVQSLRDSYPHRVSIPQSNTYGMLLFSRFPLKNIRIAHLVDDFVPSIFAMIQLNSQEAVELIALHPRPPRPQEGPSDQRDAELIQVAKHVKNQALPTVVVGDLNDVAWSHTTRLFQRISGLLDPRRGRGFYNTFPAHLPLLRFPLDHVFHSKHFRFRQLRVLASIGSDHFPILVKLYLTTAKSIHQTAVEMEPGDRDEAQELCQRGEDWDGPNTHLHTD